MTDYQSHWRLNGPVYLRAAEPGEFFVPPELATQLGRLELFCRQSQPLFVLTGEAGVGKSSVLQWLMSRLAPENHEFLLLAMIKKETESGWLTPRLCELMGVTPSGSLTAQIRATATRLDDLIAEKRKLIVAIDAAHLISTDDAMTEVVSYLNLQVFAGGTLSFILCGADSLKERVFAQESLATRVSYHMALKPLSRASTAAYLAARAQVQGLAMPFDEASLDVIHGKTRGVLAAVNGLAENCLIEAAARGARLVTSELAQAASEHLFLGASGALPASSVGPRLPKPARPGTPRPHKGPKDGAAATLAAAKAEAEADGDPKTKSAAAIALTSLFKASSSRQKR